MSGAANGPPPAASRTSRQSGAKAGQASFVADLERAATHALASKHCSAVAIAMGSLNEKGHVQLRHAKTYGLSEPSPPTIRLDAAQGQFDVGALTAGLVPAMLAMQWLAKGRLDLQRPLGSVLPAASKGPLAEVPLYALLDHTSGIGPQTEALAQAIAALPRPERVAGRSAALPRVLAEVLPKGVSAQAVVAKGGPFAADDTAKLVARLLAVVPEASPGKAELPSPLDSLLLGWALEAVGQAPLDALFARDVLRPLGVLSGLNYYRCGPRGPYQPPTERPGEAKVAVRALCSFRRRVLRAEPADVLTYALGGVAGHSGLFGSVSAVYAMLLPLLEAARGAPSVLHQGSVTRFLARSRKLPDMRYALGFEVACRANGMAPGRWHPRSVGLTCPSGQAVFLDPGYGVLGVLLSNWGIGNRPDAAKAFDVFRLRVFDAIASFAAA